MWGELLEQDDLVDPSLLLLSEKMTSRIFKYPEMSIFTFPPAPSRYDVELFQRIERLIGKRLPLYLTVEEEVMALMERVSEAQRHAKMVCFGETCVRGRRTTVVLLRLQLNCLSMVLWLPSQELQSSMENSKRGKRKFREEEEEEELEERPRTKKRKTLRHS